MRNARGHSLPELMIGLAIGLSAMVTTWVVWQTAHQTWLTVTAHQSLHHNARVALSALVDAIQRAGAAPLVGVSGSRGVTLAPLTFSAVDATIAVRGDSLVLTHWRALDDADCQGNRSGSHTLAHNQFQRSASSDDLACKDTGLVGSSLQPLAEGLEEFRVRLAEVSVDGQTLQWKSPNQVLQGSQIAAVEVCLRMSQRPPLQVPLPATVGCDGEAVPPDGRLRQTWRQTVALRNRAAPS